MPGRSHCPNACAPPSLPAAPRSNRGNLTWIDLASHRFAPDEKIPEQQSKHHRKTKPHDIEIDVRHRHMQVAAHSFFDRICCAVRQGGRPACVGANREPTQKERSRDERNGKEDKSTE